MKQFVYKFFWGICFGVVFTIFILLKDKLNINITEKELIIWALVIWVVVSVFIRTIMGRINNRKVDNREHTKIN